MEQSDDPWQRQYAANQRKIISDAAELSAVKRDAARYRFIKESSAKSYGFGVFEHDRGFVINTVKADDMDSVIDRRLSAISVTTHGNQSDMQSG